MTAFNSGFAGAVTLPQSSKISAAKEDAVSKNMNATAAVSKWRHKLSSLDIVSLPLLLRLQRTASEALLSRFVTISMQKSGAAAAGQTSIVVWPKGVSRSSGRRHFNLVSQPLFDFGRRYPITGLDSVIRIDQSLLRDVRQGSAFVIGIFVGIVAEPMVVRMHLRLVQRQMSFVISLEDIAAK